MLRVRTLLAIGMSALAVPFARSSGQQLDAPVDSTKLYHAMLAKFSAGDTALADVTTLRFVYAASTGYQPVIDQQEDWKEQIIKAAAANDAVKAARIADRVVALDPLNLEAYVLRAGVRRQRGDALGAKLDGGRARALYASIISNGDGSRDQPWAVIRVDEEYYVLMVKGLGVKKQALETCAGRPCDAITLDGADKAGRKTVYFDVSIPLSFEQKMLGKP